MTKEEFDAIKARASFKPRLPSGVSICVICERDGHPIHPDELGVDASLTFKEYAESFLLARADRQALLKWIEEGFDVDWLPADAAKVSEPKKE